jgi:hypothetical protein
MSSEETDEREEQQDFDIKRHRIPRWLIWGAAMGAILSRLGRGVAVSFGLHALRKSSDRRRVKKDSSA